MNNNPDLDAIERAVAAAASKADNLEELAKAADALKAVAEARQQNNAETQAQRTFGLSRMQSWAALLVPLASIAALLVTIITQSIQLAANAVATNRQIQDTEWRDLLSSLRSDSTYVYSDVTIVPRLKSFATSEAYGAQAKEMALLLAGRLAAPDGFSALISWLFPEINSKNVADVVAVSRKLVMTQQLLQAQCPAGYNCNSGLTAAQIRDRGPAVAKVDKVYDELVDLYSQQSQLSQRLASYMQKNQPVSFNLSQAGVVEADLADLQFSDANLSGTVFDDDDFTKAQLLITEFAGVQFIRSNWWDASKISSGLLKYLIAQWNPKRGGNNNPRVPVSDQQYVTRVRSLCRNVGITCPTPRLGPVSDQ